MLKFEAAVRYLPITATVVHSILISIMAAVVAALDGEAVMLWNLFMLVDFPASVIGASLFAPLEVWSMENLGERWTLTAGYAAYFALLGGLQYYGLAKLLVFLIGHGRAT